MTEFLIFVVGFAIGFGGASIGFVWLNRNKPAQVDSLETKVRDWKKP